MESKQSQLRLTITISVIILWLTANLYYFWLKIAGVIFLITGLVELVCFLIALVLSIILTIRIIMKPDWRNLKNILTIGFAVLVVTAMNIKQLQANENTFQSPVKMRACYEGTMNTSHLYFRENGTFEDYNIGWFALVHYISGTWRQVGDTLYLDFEGEKNNLLDEKIVIKENRLFKLHSDTLVASHYYLGDCKGLN
jgi:hypothetical protein